MKKLDMTKVKEIRDQDIVPILENALNYGHPWHTLYMALLEEITELRKQVLALGGQLPMANTMTGMDYQKLYFTDPRGE
jgi:pyruvate dehydrogenase complex dehydrogenase (E1) component